MKETLTSELGVGLAGAGQEGVGDPVDLGDRHGGDDADGVRLGHLAGDQPGQVGRLVDPVVEDGEVGLGRTDARAEDVGDVGVVRRHPPGDALGAEGVAHDQLVAALGVLAHDAGEVGRLDALRPGVLDAELLLGLDQGDVDLVDPGLFDRRLEDGGDAQGGVAAARRLAGAAGRAIRRSATGGDGENGGENQRHQWPARGARYGCSVSGLCWTMGLSFRSSSRKLRLGRGSVTTTG